MSKLNHLSTEERVILFNHAFIKGLRNVLSNVIGENAETVELGIATSAGEYIDFLSDKEAKEIVESELKEHEEQRDVFMKQHKSNNN